MFYEDRTQDKWTKRKRRCAPSTLRFFESLLAAYGMTSLMMNRLPGKMLFSIKWLPLVVVFLHLCTTVTQAQEIQVNEDPKITQLMRNWVDNNRTAPHIDGWRVQLMASTDRQQVEDGRMRFRTYYPEVPADWIHEKPYYKLRVGAFRSRLEAMAFIAQMTEFPGAYPARDMRIHPRDFLE